MLATMVRADTQVGLDFQGLTGVPVVALQGGTTAFPTTTGEPKLLTADPKAGQSMTQAARQALLRLDALLSENAAPLHDTITNLQTFAAALAQFRPFGQYRRRARTHDRWRRAGGEDGL